MMYACCVHATMHIYGAATDAQQTVVSKGPQVPGEQSTIKSNLPPPGQLPTSSNMEAYIRVECAHRRSPFYASYDTASMVPQRATHAYVFRRKCLTVVRSAFGGVGVYVRPRESMNPNHAIAPT